jgi:hypothetical protein
VTLSVTAGDVLVASTVASGFAINLALVARWAGRLEAKVALVVRALERHGIL